MKTDTRLIIALLSAAGFAGSALGQVTLYADEREAWGQITGKSFDNFPQPYQPWIAGGGFVDSGGPGGPQMFSMVYQDSTLTPTTFGCDTYLNTGSRGGTRPPTGGSIFGAVFVPEEGTRCTMQGTLTGARAWLSRDLATIWSVEGSLPFSFDQVLDTGLYELHFSLTGLGGGSYTFTGRFISAGSCLSDLNHDSVVDDLDFSIFVRQYDEATYPFASLESDHAGIADLNMDFVVDDADFVIFVAAYDQIVCS